MSEPTVPSGYESADWQVRPVLDVLRLDDVLDHLFGQVRREVGDLVGIEVLGRGHDLGAVHVLQQRVANRVGHLEQDLAVAAAGHQPPCPEAILERQALEHIRDVGGMQLLQQLPGPSGKQRVVRRILVVVAAGHDALHGFQEFLGGARDFDLVGASARLHGSSAAGMRARMIWVLCASQAV